MFVKIHLKKGIFGLYKQIENIYFNALIFVCAPILGMSTKLTRFYHPISQPNTFFRFFGTLEVKKFFWVRVKGSSYPRISVR